MKTICEKVYAAYLWLDDHELVYPLEIAIIIVIFVFLARYDR
jgi:hypothetical protein